MWALVDCNSFFCSVEKVFHPGLQGRPVCVLSSNDGCIVALTPEAKAVGLRRGDPLFKVSDIVERHQVRVFSTNMQLYAAMSKRVTNILRQSIMRVENYSIDESFCDLNGYEKHFDRPARFFVPALSLPFPAAVLPDDSGPCGGRTHLEIQTYRHHGIYGKCVCGRWGGPSHSRSYGFDDRFA